MLSDKEMDELITKMAQLASDTDESIVGIALIVDTGYDEEKGGTYFELVNTGRMPYKENLMLLHDLACLRLDRLEALGEQGANIPVGYLPVIDKRKQN